MAFGGDVDTLSLTFDKLQYIFNGYGPIRDSFIETNTRQREGNLSNEEFFDQIQQGIMRFSALEFLAIKAVFEIKKSIDRQDRVTKTEVISDLPSTSLEATHGHSIASFIAAKALPQALSADAKEKKSCSHCGSQITERMRFCTNCGNKM